jgi:hypothetical protein
LGSSVDVSVAELSVSGVSPIACRVAKGCVADWSSLPRGRAVGEPLSGSVASDDLDAAELAPRFREDWLRDVALWVVPLEVVGEALSAVSLSLALLSVSSSVAASLAVLSVALEAVLPAPRPAARAAAGLEPPALELARPGEVLPLAGEAVLSEVLLPLLEVPLLGTGFFCAEVDLLFDLSVVVVEVPSSASVVESLSVEVAVVELVLSDDDLSSSSAETTVAPHTRHAERAAATAGSLKLDTIRMELFSRGHRRDLCRARRWPSTRATEARALRHALRMPFVPRSGSTQGVAA